MNDHKSYQKRKNNIVHYFKVKLGNKFRVINV